MRRSFRRSPAVMFGLAVCGALAAPLQAQEAAAPPLKASLRWGGALGLAAPTGEFARNIEVAGGLSGYALYGRPAGALALRLDGGWLLYGTQTLRRPVGGTEGRVLEDVATTDNWIAHLSLGPQLMARSGRVRPYANAFAGGAYFATSSELVRPRGRGVTLLPGQPLLTRDVLFADDPFRTTTHYDDFTMLYGAGAGLLVGLGHGHTAVDLGVRYLANNPVRFLAEGDPIDGPPRRSAGHLIEFRIGITGLN